jgi:hypothetical protein
MRLIVGHVSPITGENADPHYAEKISRLIPVAGAPIEQGRSRRRRYYAGLSAHRLATNSGAANIRKKHTDIAVPKFKYSGS